MKFEETRMGGEQDHFPETSWGTLLVCSDLTSLDRKASLDRLVSRYWRPVYRFIRRRWNKPVEDVKDLTQGFFCHVLESDLVSKSDPNRGRFREFVKAALRNYLAQVHRKDTTIKRGGLRRSLPLEDVRGEDDRDPGLSPEEVFDRQWASEVLKQTLPRLKQEFIAAGKDDFWQVYDRYELSTGATYESVARELGLTLSQVKNRLDDVRERLHALVLETIGDTVSSASEARKEWDELFEAQ